MRCAILLMVVCVLGAVVSGCEDGGGSPPRDLAGTWQFDVASQDKFVSFVGTSMVITNTGAGYEVLWMSPTPNGRASLDTNTWTVTMHVESAPTVLDLVGTLEDASTMRGNGTVDGYGGLRVGVWQASRQD
jgi:hypothetical protein